MELTDEDLQKFVELWNEEFKEDITLDEARHYGSQLLELYLALATVSLPSDQQPTS